MITMLTPHMIQTAAVITALIILLSVTIWRFYSKRHFIYVHWSMFVSMAIGAGIIWYFYTRIEKIALRGGNAMELIQFSRWLFLFILFMTALMGLGALVYWVFNIRDDE